MASNKTELVEPGLNPHSNPNDTSYHIDEMFPDIKSLDNFPTEALLPIFIATDDITLHNLNFVHPRFEPIAQEVFERRYANKYFVIEGESDRQQEVYSRLLSLFGRSINAIEAKGIRHIDNSHWMVQLSHKHTPNLEKLRFTECSFNNANEVLSQNHRLTHLSIRGGYCDDDDNPICLPEYCNLKALELSSFSHVRKSSLLQILQNNPQLESLILRSCDHYFTFLEIMGIVCDHLDHLTELNILDSYDFDDISPPFSLMNRFVSSLRNLGLGAERSQDSNLRMVAIALSGFSFEKSLWRSQCINALSQIMDPHLRALFAFLTPDNDSYDIVLKESGISLSDRMAFACHYLCDIKLADYIKTMIQQCTDNGDLNGLLVTGTSESGINLLQSYLDQTDDVQTVALISIKFLSKELISHSQVEHWIASYRELLDIWGLWVQRANFDITMGQIQPQPRYARSVFLLCSFCGKSVSGCLQEEARLRATSSSTNAYKLSSCPNCRKPLPRCSLCLMHMGTTLGLSLQNPTGHACYGWQSKPFSKWFSWCQSCRHGGHTEHLTQWFSQHLECPVASCTCRCFTLDFSIPETIKETLIELFLFNEQFKKLGNVSMYTQFSRLVTLQI